MCLTKNITFALSWDHQWDFNIITEYHYNYPYADVAKQ